MINIPKNLKGELQQSKVNRLIQADKSYNEKLNDNVTQDSQSEVVHVETNNQPAEAQVEVAIEPPPTVQTEEKEVVPIPIVEMEAKPNPVISEKPKKDKTMKPNVQESINTNSSGIDPAKSMFEQQTGEEWFQWFHQAQFESIVQEFIKQYPKKQENIKYEKEQRNILLSDELFSKIKQQLKQIDRMCEDTHESNAEDAKAHSNRGWIGWYIENVLRSHFKMDPMRRGKN